ncbi:uncharacterized protein LOC105079804 isoform X1 [Camelus bactrianus]|uniref:Uncharacterized protein LOC105079804 isoform X1 n=1 Tax=Camelus bactrianus TaxID=9837 RepID=A0AC58QW46_CAMBA
MRVEWSPDPEKMLNGQSPLPIGEPCAGWSACGTRLLRREAGLSDVGSIPGSLGIQPGEGLAASGRRKARAAYMLMAQRGEAICHVMRQMKRVSRQKTRSAKSQLLFWREVNVLWNFNNGCLETKQRSPLQMRNTRPALKEDIQPQLQDLSKNGRNMAEVQRIKRKTCSQTSEKLCWRSVTATWYLTQTSPRLLSLGNKEDFVH